MVFLLLLYPATHFVRHHHHIFCASSATYPAPPPPHILRNHSHISCATITYCTPSPPHILSHYRHISVATTWNSSERAGNQISFLYKKGRTTAKPKSKGRRQLTLKTISREGNIHRGQPQCKITSLNLL